MSLAQNNDSANLPQLNDDALLDSIRSILLRDDREQLDSTFEDAQKNIETMRSELDALQAEINALRAEKADAQSVVPTVQHELSRIANEAVQNNHSEMAEALGPLIGAATTVQIRKSKQEMADALSPVMGTAITTAIQDALRDFQRGLDAQMSQRAKSNNVIRKLYFTSKGTSESEQAMRNALPYKIREIFLIQKESGLLLSHYSDSAETTDSDLVSAMLTAIRDFVGDAFSADGELTELNEVQFGDHQIVLKSGEFAYAAAVVEGIVPAGLGSKLQQRVATLNGEHHDALQAYDGDPEDLPDFEAMLEGFSAEITQNDIVQDVPRNLNFLIKGGAGCLTIVTLAWIIFTVWFVVKLFPIAWSGPMVSSDPSITVSTSNEVWVLSEPHINSETLIQLPVGADAELVAVYGNWRKVHWQKNDGAVEGWVQSRNVIDPDEIPHFIVTPVAEHTSSNN